MANVAFLNSFAAQQPQATSSMLNTQNVQQNQKIATGLKNALQVVQSASDPQQTFMRMLQGNPNVKAVMDIVNQHGGDPQRAFYAEAERRGIDPEQVLSMLR